MLVFLMQGCIYNELQAGNFINPTNVVVLHTTSIERVQNLSVDKNMTDPQQRLDFLKHFFHSDKNAFVGLHGVIHIVQR